MLKVNAKYESILYLVATNCTKDGTVFYCIYASSCVINVRFRIDQARRTTGRVHSTGTVYLQYARARGGHVAATIRITSYMRDHKIKILMFGKENIKGYRKTDKLPTNS